MERVTTSNNMYSFVGEADARPVGVCGLYRAIKGDCRPCADALQDPSPWHPVSDAATGRSGPCAISTFPASHLGQDEGRRSMKVKESTLVYRLIDGRWERQSGGAPNLCFGGTCGYAFTLSEDLVAVGAPHDDSAGPAAGALYLFSRGSDHWRRHERLVGDDTVAGDNFGHCFAMSGDLLAVGAPGYMHQGIRTGSVYLFRQVDGVWRQHAVLFPSDSDYGAGFGSSVALDDRTLVVGAPGEVENGALGACYLFELQDGAWQQQARLLAWEAGLLGGFGRSVAVQGDLMAVASVREFDVGGSGAIFVFERGADGWRRQQRVVPEAPGLSFNGAVQLGENILSIGVRRLVRG